MHGVETINWVRILHHSEREIFLRVLQDGGGVVRAWKETGLRFLEEAVVLLRLLLVVMRLIVLALVRVEEVVFIVGVFLIVNQILR